MPLSQSMRGWSTFKGGGSLDKCQLCFRAETKRNPLNKHHIKGKRYPDIMKVHSVTCHKFCDWVTALYVLHGWESRLSEQFLRYLYQRVLTLQDDRMFVLPIYEQG